MVNRGEIIWLGIASGVMGCLVGGMMLGIGMDLIVNGQPLGWLLLLPGAPVSAVPGWLLARTAGTTASSAASDARRHQDQHGEHVGRTRSRRSR